MLSTRKILIITFNQIDKKSGGGVASRLLINLFAELADECLLVYPDSGTADDIHLNSKVVILPCRDYRSKWHKGLDTYRGVIHRFTSYAKDIFVRHKPDVVIFDTSIVSYGIIKFIKDSNTPVITIHHNVESEFYKSNRPPLPVRLPLMYFISRAERLSLIHSDLNLTLTEYDKIKLAQLHSKDLSPEKLRHLGLYGEPGMEKYSPSPGLKSLKGKSIRFIITGSLSFPQSEESIIDFVDRYIPVLEKIMPGYGIVVAGSQPTERLKRHLSRRSRIELVEDPSNLLSYITKADVYICPVDRGSGIKLRIMDALKAGLPVISHENSCRGYEKFVEMGYVLSYHSPDSFSESLNQVTCMEIDAEKISKTYYEEFSFSNGVNRLRELLRSE